jgi:ABC-type sugar transport system ATPase subunit
MLLLLIAGLAESVQEGAAAGKALLLGSLSKNAMSQVNIANETNITNQTNITTNQESKAVAIKNPMSIIPISRKLKGLNLPNSIQANTIAYRFTT